MNQKVNKILKAISWILIILVIILALLLVGPKLFGMQVFSVLSGSMEPEYPTGSLIYVVDVDPAELEVNNVITFAIAEDQTATHRIIELVPDDEDPNYVRFRTKGDANDVEDGSLVIPENVVGKPVFMIPLLGYLAISIQQPPGLYIAIIVALALIFFTLAVDIIVADEEEEKKKKELKKQKKAKKNAVVPAEPEISAAPIPDTAPEVMETAVPETENGIETAPDATEFAVIEEDSAEENGK